MERRKLNLTKKGRKGNEEKIKHEKRLVKEGSEGRIKKEEKEMEN